MLATSLSSQCRILPSTAQNALVYVCASASRMARPETDGCYCQVNNLLRDIIQEIAGNFDFVIIDGEARTHRRKKTVKSKWGERRSS